MNNSILFVAVIFLLSLLIPVDLDARAGGGGSYRSSGSSSSSSSSRSSYSSSSSSSYRSSSSSSYRSSSSSSGSSSSSYRSAGPSYRAINNFESVERILDFQAPGKLALQEKIEANLLSLGAFDGYEFEPSHPSAPWKVERTQEPTNVFTYVVSGHDRIVTGDLKGAPGNNKVEFQSTVAYAATPTSLGSILAFEKKSLCGNAKKCNVAFHGLTPMDSIELVYANMTQSPKVIAARTFDNAALQGVESLIIRFSGMHHRLAAETAWKEAPCKSITETKLVIEPSGVVELSDQILKKKVEEFSNCGYLNIPESATQNLKQSHFLRKMRNIGYTYHFYSSLNLRVEFNATDYGYQTLGTVLANAKPSALLEIPLPAYMDSSSYLNFPQTSASFITTRKKIDVQLPQGMKIAFRLYACENPERYKNPCKVLRPLPVKETQHGATVTLVSDEPQVQSAWLLKGVVQQGEFTEPSLWTKLHFGFSHYHTFGYYPRWVFWFYFSLILGGILLAIFIIGFLAYRKHRAHKQQMEKERAEKAKYAEASATEAIRKHDPAFDIEAFKARGRTIAEKIQTAWCAGDMSSCRRYLSQGVYNRFRTQLKIMREIEKKQNAMADFHIRAFGISSSVRSGPYDAIAVRLDAEARDTMLDATINPTDALAMAQRAPLTRFTEYYTFMRRHDAQTTQKENADACSHCGTPFAPEGELTKCKSCGAVEGSGTFDWVLAEITQEVEYSGLTSRKDIAEPWSADRIEDRASYVFWRDVLAKCTGDAQVLQRDATTQYLEKGIQKQPLYQAAVGAADLESLKERDGVLYASVRIEWSAAKNPKAEPTHAESILTLAAKREAAEATTFADPGCASCGAPLPESDSATCAYCHAPVTKKNADWLLVDVQNGE